MWENSASDCRLGLFQYADFARHCARNARRCRADRRDLPRFRRSLTTPVAEATASAAAVDLLEPSSVSADPVAGTARLRRCARTQPLRLWCPLRSAGRFRSGTQQSLDQANEACQREGTRRSPVRKVFRESFLRLVPALAFLSGYIITRHHLFGRRAHPDVATGGRDWRTWLPW